MNRFVAAAISSLLYCSGSAAAAEPVTLTELAARYSELKVAPSTVAVQNLVLTQGHLSIHLSNGAAAPVLAGDETIGFFFDGNGTFEYTSTDPLEFAVMQHNVKNGVKLPVTKNDASLKIGGRVEQLLFLATGAPLPALDGSTAPPLNDEFAKHRAWFARDPAGAAEHPFIQRRIDQSPEAFVRVSWKGGNDALLYELDPLLARSETLWSLHPIASNVGELEEFVTRALISEQMINHDRRDPIDPPFLLTALDYTLTASDSDDAKLEVTETVVTQGRPRRALRFALYNWTFGNRWRKHFFHLREVVDASGKKLSFDHRNDELIVALAQPVQPGTAVRLRFRIDGDFLVRPQGDNFWQLGIEPWFPQPDLNGMYYTVHSVVKAKGNFIPFAPGKTLSRKTEDGFNIVENVIEKPVAFAVVHAGKYKTVEKTKDGLTVRVASYAMQNSGSVERLIGLAFDVIKFYDFILGEFPFPEFNIIEVPQYGWGQAPPATMFITRELFDRLDPGYGFTETEVNSRFAHEIAHQYWGQVVKMPSYSEQWITEAFADYSAALFIQQAYGKQGKARFDRIRSTWRGNANVAKNHSSIALANQLRTPFDPSIAQRHRQYLLYDKGPLLLDALRKELGDDVFLTFLKSYQRSFAWKFGTTKHAAGLLKFMTKKDYTPFFESFYWSTEMPK